VRVGVHLPQYGRVASADSIRRAAQHAEAVGFADIWISDHVVHPAEQTYPSAYLLDPIVTLSWAAAVTETVGLGTSVLVLPQHNPLELANQLATVDNLSGGRVLVGVGVGWSEREFDALGYDFANRGPRTDEIITLLRTAWRDDPATFHGAYYDFDDIRFLPRPAHDIPIWVGGSSERAYHRGVTLGDGYQLIGVTPAEAKPIIDRLRQDRPEPSFTISLRTGWDPQGMEPAQIRDEYAAFGDAGVQHAVSAPWRSNLDDWLRSMDLLAEIVR